jgi:hypothetical protein
MVPFPEEWEAKEVDQRSGIYSLVTVLFEMAIGRVLLREKIRRGQDSRE